MSFLLPQFLWGLLALAPLALAYLIKVHPVRKKTSAWFMWEGIFQERRVSSLLQRLRDWLSLLLMALAFIFLILALARPVLLNTAGTEQVLLLIDNSLSMNAEDRLADAQRAARGIIRALPADGRAAVFSLSGELASATGFTSSRRELMDGIEAVTGSDVPFNVHALQQIAASLQANQRMLLFSDGCFEGADLLPEGIELIKVGAPADNVGIAAFDMRRIPGDNEPLGVFFRIYSDNTEPIEVDAVLSFENAENIRRVFPLNIEPGLNQPEITAVPAGETGRWILTLEVNDALARDNVGYAVIREIDPVRIAVRAPQTHVFWQLCVEAFASGVNGLEMVDSDPELELYRGAVADDAAERLAVFAPAGASPFWQSVSGEESVAAVRVLLPSHPLMRYAGLDGLVVHGVRTIQPPEQAVILAETDGGIPLVYKTSQGGNTAYVLNFDPAQNHFFLNPLYPVLVWSLASELMQLGLEQPSSIRSGGMADLPAEFAEGEVTLPSGESRYFSGGRFGPMERFGFYTFESQQKSIVVACSGAVMAESRLDNTAIEGTEVQRTAGYPLSEWFMGAALLLFSAECALYHRRKVG